MQEVPAWGKLNGFTYSSHTIVSFESCDCCLIIPRHWMSAVRNLSSGAYWCGAVLGNYIFLSAHVLDHLEEGGRAATVFEETVNCVHNIRSSSPDVHFEVFLGVDANVGLPPMFEDISGDAVLPLRSSHTISKVRSVASWIAGLGLAALNTFSSPPYSEDTLWTRMARRRPSSRAQIDFLMTSRGVSGYARAHFMSARTFKRSDHRLLCGRLRSHIAAARIRQSVPPSKGWRPTTSEAAEEFKFKCLRFANVDLEALQGGIRQSAAEVAFSTCGGRAHEERTKCNLQSTRREKLWPKLAQIPVRRQSRSCGVQSGEGTNGVCNALANTLNKLRCRRCSRLMAS